jgi:tetratricopeptide (TPR) repeat protein
MDAALRSGALAAQREREQERLRAEAERDEAAHRVRLGRQAAAQGNAGWAHKYQALADVAAEEEYAERARAASERRVAEEARRVVGGCNHDHRAERELFELSTEDKLAGCARFREEGAAWFDEGQFARAAERFRKVVVWLDYTFAEGAEQQRRCDDHALAAHVAMAVCALRLRDHRAALECARLALRLEPDNVKALYVLAKSLRLTAELEQAADTLGRALRLEPANVELRHELAYLRHSVIAYRRDAQAQARAMFAQHARGLEQEPEAPRTTRSAARPRYGPPADLLGPRAGDGRDDDDSDAFAATAIDDEEVDHDDLDEEQDDGEQRGGVHVSVSGASLCARGEENAILGPL